MKNTHLSIVILCCFLYCQKSFAQQTNNIEIPFFQNITNDGNEPIAISQHTDNQPTKSPAAADFYVATMTSAPSGGLSISEFIALLRAEESKYSETEQKDTKRMITRFRKLFYGSASWDRNLIPKAKHIACVKPYKIVKSENTRKKVHFKVNFLQAASIQLSSFEMVDEGFYPVHPDTENRPAINMVTNADRHKLQTQEVRLEEGPLANHLVDIGHVLCAMDASFNPSDVNVAGAFYNINRNIDAVTWIGDLASAEAEIFVEKMNNQDISNIEIQNIINYYSSAPDMLGDIDGIVIGAHYCRASNTKLQKVSDILEHYYLQKEGVKTVQEERYKRFAINIGLEWDAQQSKFKNLQTIIKHFEHQVNDATVLYVAKAAKDASFFDLIKATPLVVSLTFQRKRSKLLLKCFFKELEKNCGRE